MGTPEIRHACFGLLAPRILALYAMTVISGQRAAGRVHPFCVSRQAFALPPGKRLCLVPTNADHGMILQALRECSVPPIPWPKHTRMIHEIANSFSHAHRPKRLVLVSTLINKNLKLRVRHLESVKPESVHSCLVVGEFDRCAKVTRVVKFPGRDADVARRDDCHRVTHVALGLLLLLRRHLGRKFRAQE